MVMVVTFKHWTYSGFSTK